MHLHGSSSELFTEQASEMLLKYSAEFWLPLLHPDTLCNFVYKCRGINGEVCGAAMQANAGSS